MVYTAASMIVWMLLSNQYKVKYDNGYGGELLWLLFNIPQSKLHTKTEQYLPTLWLMLLHLEYETIYACV